MSSNITIHGVSITTVSKVVKKGSKAQSVLIAISALENNRQQKVRCKEIAMYLMNEHEIPKGYSSTLVGRLCCGVAKTNEKEVFSWVLRETGHCSENSDLYDTDFIQSLSRKLWDALEEIKYGNC